MTQGDGDSEEKMYMSVNSKEKQKKKINKKTGPLIPLILISYLSSFLGPFSSLPYQLPAPVSGLGLTHAAG